MPVSGTVVGSGNFRTSNVGGVAGWGVFTLHGVAADNTYAYSLQTNLTNPNIGGGVPNAHLFRTPFANFDVAHTTILQSFTITITGNDGINGLAIRQSDGILAARLANGDLYTFDPTNGYVANRLGNSGGGGPSSDILSVAFDPTDPTVLWSMGYNCTLRKWRIGTGDLGTVTFTPPTYSLYCSPSGMMVGAASWDIANSPKGVQVWEPSTGLAKCPFGLRWLSVDRDGVGNGNHTEGNLANRAASANVRDVCMDKDGLIYAASPGGTTFSIRRVTADWLTVDSISMASLGVGLYAGSHITVSPDVTKIVATASEFLVKVT